MTDHDRIVQNLEVCIKESWDLVDPKTWITRGKPEPAHVLSQLIKNQASIMIALRQTVKDTNALRFAAFEKQFGGDGGAKK